MEPLLSGRLSSGHLRLPGSLFAKKAILLGDNDNYYFACGAKMAGRKCSVVTFDRKLKIIEDLRGGKSQRFVADLYKMPKSMVGDIWKDRDKIEHFVSTSACPSFAKKRCIIRDAKFDELDKACYTWFLQQRSKNVPVSGPLLKEKALQLFPSIYPK